MEKKGNSFNFELGQDASVDYLQLDETIGEYEPFFAELINSVNPFSKKCGFFSR
jgi:hypothetical protein